MIADGAIQSWRRRGGEFLVGERDVKEIALVEIRRDEPEDVKVEVVSRDHGPQSEPSLAGDND